jgi:hypothetical protein
MCKCADVQMCECEEPYTLMMAGSIKIFSVKPNNHNNQRAP